MRALSVFLVALLLASCGEDPKPEPPPTSAPKVSDSSSGNGATTPIPRPSSVTPATPTFPESPPDPEPISYDEPELPEVDEVLEEGGEIDVASNSTSNTRVVNNWTERTMQRYSRYNFGEFTENASHGAAAASRVTGLDFSDWADRDEPYTEMELENVIAPCEMAAYVQADSAAEQMFLLGTGLKNPSSENICR